MNATEMQTTTTAADKPGFWTGMSGEPVSGDAVAHHLDAALAILDKRGWTRTWRDEPANLPDADDESLSVKDMLRQLLRTVRDSLVDSGPVTAESAVYRAQRDAGDVDTWHVASRVLDEMVRARTGYPTAMFQPWEIGRAHV